MYPPNAITSESKASPATTLAIEMKIDTPLFWFVVVFFIALFNG